MPIPNTTPTPNIIFNGLMAKMTDTEFRVVMAVVRATLGWEIDHKTGMRKTEDWISYSQLRKITGRGSASLAKAIDSCIKKGWIEARDKEGKLLDTKNKRVGKKVFYRLGPEILLRDEDGQILVKESKPFQKVKRLTSSKSEKVFSTSSESENSTSSKSEISESEAYKRNTIQKKNNTKNMSSDLSDDRPFSFKKELEKLLSDKRLHIRIIGLYFKHKDFIFENKEQLKNALARNLRPARRLVGYSDEDIIKTFKWLDDEEYLEKWTLETVEKYIDEVRKIKFEVQKEIQRSEEINK